MRISGLPRFKRNATVAPMQLTERDRDIIRLVHRHRFMRSHQIVALVNGSSQQLLRRLQLLYHHGYLERPRVQIDYYHQSGNHALVYGLGNKGGALMQQKLSTVPAKLSWGEKNRAVRGIFLEHALLVTDIMVAFELACRKTGCIRLLTEEDLSTWRKMEGEDQSVQWRVNLRGGLNLGVIPDRVFALEFPAEKGESDRAYFFLEADRGTMPVKRRDLSQTSFFRKLLAYKATWVQSIHQKKFGFNRFRVLTVTTSPARVKSLVEACSELKRGHGLFLFADKSLLERPEDILSSSWSTARHGETTALLS